MILTDTQRAGLKGKSPEGVYMAVRALVRAEFGIVDKDELAEALDDAVAADLLDERDVKEFSREF